MLYNVDNTNNTSATTTKPKHSSYFENLLYNIIRYFKGKQYLTILYSYSPDTATYHATERKRHSGNIKLQIT